MPASCNLLSGKGARLFAQHADCAKAPWSPSTTFAPSFSGVTVASAFFFGNFSGVPDFTYGSEVQEVNVAAANGATVTAEGRTGGRGTFTIIMDADSPLADGGDPAAEGKIRSGQLFDFVITFNLTEPTGNTAADKIVGRFRAGAPSVPIRLSGEMIEISIPFITHDVVYGDVVGQPNLSGS